MNRFLSRLSEIEYSVLYLVLVPIVVGGVRGLLETILVSVRPTYAKINIPILHYVVFYLVLLLCVVVILKVVTGREHRRLVGVASVGLLLAWLPPFLDLAFWLSGLEQPRRYYFFFEEICWSLRSSRMLVGETIVLWLSVLFLVIYVAWSTRNPLRALLGGILYYGLIHVLGWAWYVLVVAIVGSGSQESVMHMGWIGLAAAFAIYLVFNSASMFPSFRRLGHALPWGLLAAIGARLGGMDWWTVGLLGAVFAAAVFMMVFHNDYFDREMDGACGGRRRPVTKDDVIFITFLLALLALHVFWIFPERFYLIVAFVAIATAYHLPGIRLKRFFGVSYLMEGTTATAAFMFGLGQQGLRTASILPLVCFAMVFFGFLTGSLMKDYKDIEQDRSAQIGTFYTRLLAKGFGLARIHLAASSLLTAALAAVPAYLLVVGEAPWRAAVAGALAVVPQICLHAIRDRRVAVQAAIWSVNAYLGALIIILPGEVVRLFH